MAVTVHSYEPLVDEVPHLPRADRSLLAGRWPQRFNEDETAISPECRAESRPHMSIIDSRKTKLISTEDGWKDITILKI